MAVRSTRLFGTSTLAVADAVVYTVPADRTAIIKTLVMFNRDAATQIASLAVNASASTSPQWRYSIPTLSHVMEKEFFLVLNPGDTLHAVIAGATVGRIAAFGALLEGAPS